MNQVQQSNDRPSSGLTKGHIPPLSVGCIRNSPNYVGDIYWTKINIAASIINVISALLMSSSYSLAQWIVGRLVIGVGVCIISGTVTVVKDGLTLLLTVPLISLSNAADL